MTLFIIKIIVTVTIVLGLSVIAERVSPRWAGMLGGYPLGTAIVLIFIGYEEGTAFAASSAVHTLAGLSANLSIFATYGLVLTLRPHSGFVLPALCALAAFFAVGVPLSWVSFDLIRALTFIIPVVVLCMVVFRRFADMRIKTAVRLSFWVTGIRAATACVVVLSITGLANTLGPEMAGVLAGFPSTVLPMVVIVHFTYGPAPVLTIIKHFPSGLGAMITFAVVYALYLDELGLWLGTLMSFGAATLYLLSFSLVQEKMRRIRLGASVS